MRRPDRRGILVRMNVPDPPAADESARLAVAARESARLAVAAWESAVNGDGAALAAMAEPDVVHWLLHPVYKPWQIAPGPVVTSIDAHAGADPGLLWVYFEFSGRRKFADPPGQDDAETPFAGLLQLRPAGDGSRRLTSGQVKTLDEYLGYVFTRRRETPEEYRRRVTAAGPGRGFRLLAGFAEHDEKFGSSAEVVIWRESAPTRDESVQLIWPALEEEAARVLGAGEWRLSLNWLDLIELLGEPPDAPTPTA
jgi:hypothetical protein